MILRRLVPASLLVPSIAVAAARLTGEGPDVLEGHRSLLPEHGIRYLMDHRLFRSNNTTAPGHPLS